MGVVPPRLLGAARLHSLPGREQTLHTDFPPRRRTGCVGSVVINVSMTDARLLFLAEDRRRVVHVVLRRGEAAYFAADVVHSGGGYDGEHVRLHFFVEEEPFPGGPGEYELTFSNESTPGFGEPADYEHVLYSGGRTDCVETV